MRGTDSPAAAAATSSAAETNKEAYPAVAMPEDVNKRGQLRGLGQELVRLDIQVSHAGPRARRRHWSWYNSGPLRQFLRAADSELHDRLALRIDTVLPEAYGEQILDLLIRQASQEVWTEWLRESLGMVASAGRADTFSRLLAVHGNSLEGWSPKNVQGLLIRAAAGGNMEVVSALLAADGVVPLVRRVDEVDWPMPAIFYAARGGHRSVVAALVDVGAPLEYKNVLGATALTTAIEHGRDGVVLELLAAGADVNNISDQGVAAVKCDVAISYPDFTPLCIATAKNNKRIVDILLAAGAYLGEELASTIPLHLAAERGYLGPLESLLAAGSNVNWMDSSGSSALHVACMNRRLSNFAGPRPLTLDAVVYNDTSESVERLLKAGAKVDRADSTGLTPLHIACQYNQERAVELLLRYGARPNLLCDEGRSPYDLVGMAALKRRETRPQQWPRRQSPATLDAEETSVADRISTLLMGACAWGRRGWLVVLRARHRRREQLADLTPSWPQPPSSERPRLEQPSEIQRHSNGAKADVGETDPALSIAQGGRLSFAAQSGVELCIGGPDDRGCVGARAPGVDGDNCGDGGRSSVGWKEAVRWLVQCSDEHGAFRQVLSFT